MTKLEVPRVFLSYSHDSDAHKHWVRRLADDLTKNGVKTTFDQWDLHVGNDIGAFMEQSFRNATYIVLVCTEMFAEKANDRKGGVGHEQVVFVGALLTSGEQGSRFLPILRSGDPSNALPLYLRSRLFIDFRDDSGYGQALDQLLRRVFGTPALTPPELGKPPTFAREAERVEADPKSKFLPAVDTGRPKAWVLVAGTGTNWRKLDEKLEQTCIALGESLALGGYGVVTGGWLGVDELTSRTFARALERAGLQLEDRPIRLLDDWTSASSAGVSRNA